jgi:hypothetical protein
MSASLPSKGLVTRVVLGVIGLVSLSSGLFVGYCAFLLPGTLDVPHSGGAAAGPERVYVLAGLCLLIALFCLAAGLKLLFLAARKRGCPADPRADPRGGHADLQTSGGLVMPSSRPLIHVGGMPICMSAPDIRLN